MNKILKAFIILTCATLTQPQIPTNHAQRRTSHPYISGDTFRAICDHFIDEAGRSFNAERVELGDIIFVRGYAEYMDEFLTFLPKIQHRFILVTHNMDATIPGNYASLLEDERLIAWFTQNKGPIDHPKLICVPIGIANAYWKHGNIKTLTQVITSIDNSVKKHLLYSNFEKRTNIQVRDCVIRYFSNKSFCYQGQKKPWSSYLKDLAESKFVLSPPGNGLDCHRTWEAMLMGSIPVLKSTSIDSLFDDLPVVIVQDWDEVTEEFLARKYQEIKSNEHNLNKLYADYWLNLIKSIQIQARQV